MLFYGYISKIIDRYIQCVPSLVDLPSTTFPKQVCLILVIIKGAAVMVGQKPNLKQSREPILMDGPILFYQNNSETLKI